MREANQNKKKKQIIRKEKEGSDYGRMDVLGTKRTGGQLVRRSVIEITFRCGVYQEMASF